MKSKLTYKPPHYHKLEVPYLAGGSSWARHYPKSNITPSYLYSYTPDYVYNEKSDMLVSIPSSQQLDDINSLPTNYDNNLIIINKNDLRDILLDAYNHTNSFNESSNEAPSNPIDLSESTKKSDSESHDSTPTESTSSHPEYFTAEYGDTLWKIAKKYHTTVDAIVKANKDKPTERGFAQIKDKDLIYAGASYYLPSDAYIDTPGNNQNSTSSKSTSQSTKSTTTQNGSDQFCLIGSDDDPLRFFRTSEEIKLAQEEFQKQNSHDNESLSVPEPNPPIDSFADAIRPYTTYLTDETLSNLTDQDLVINSDQLYDLVEKYYRHNITIESFKLHDDTDLQTISDAFDIPVSSILSSNQHLCDTETKDSNNINDVTIKKDTVISLPINYNINETISRLEPKSLQNIKNQNVPNFTKISSKQYFSIIQPYSDSKSFGDLSYSLSATDLITTFRIPEEYLYYLYEYIKEDPNINIDDKYEFTPDSNRLFRSINISSSVYSSYADGHVDFHFISSPWLQKHLRPKVYNAFMYVINSFANGNYNQTHSAYTYIPRPDEDQHTVHIRSLLSQNDVPLDTFDDDRQKAILSQAFDTSNNVDTESAQPWDQYVEDPNDLISQIQARIKYYESINDTNNVQLWQGILESLSDLN